MSLPNTLSLDTVGTNKKSATNSGNMHRIIIFLLLIGGFVHLPMGSGTNIATSNTLTIDFETTVNITSSNISQDYRTFLTNEYFFASRQSSTNQYIYSLVMFRILSNNTLEEIHQFPEDYNLIHDLVMINNTLFFAQGYHLNIYDCTNTSQPTFLSSYDTDWDIDQFMIQGSYAVLAENGMIIIDISDPSTPSKVFSIDTPEDIYSMDSEGRLFYLTSGDSILLYDMQDMTNPVLVSKFAPYPDTLIGAIHVFDGHVFVRPAGNFLILASYDDVYHPYRIIDNSITNHYSYGSDFPFLHGYGSLIFVTCTWMKIYDVTDTSNQPIFDDDFDRNATENYSGDYHVNFYHNSTDTYVYGTASNKLVLYALNYNYPTSSKLNWTPSVQTSSPSTSPTTIRSSDATSDLPPTSNGNSSSPISLMPLLVMLLLVPFMRYSQKQYIH